MGNWRVWKQAYENLTYFEDGDDLEVNFDMAFGISKVFPCHEEFWRLHIAPATNRPASIDWRAGVSMEVQRIIALNYGVLYDLYHARCLLEDILAGKLGVSLGNFTSCIKSIGDAIQKHHDLVYTAIQGHLRQRLGSALASPLTIWTDDEYNKLWKPRRDELVSYRHYITHEAARPFVVPVATPSGTPSFFVIRRQHLADRKRRPALEEQYALYQNDPSQFATVEVICRELYDDTVAWLDLAYCALLTKMEPLLDLEEYHQLWGWEGSTPMVGSGSGPLLPMPIPP